MQTADVAQRRMFTIRLSEEEEARLDALAAHYGLTVASLVRMLAKREADSLGLQVKGPPAKAVTPKKRKR